MNLVGMIVEYNPFHNGHLWHLKESKRICGADFSIAVMSGNFVQRGEPAIVDKWARAEMAVSAGVDLVLELPVVFAVRSAQYFATGGIQLLERLGIVSHVCFGAETPSLELLKSAAISLGSDDTIAIMQKNMKSGATYAASLASALTTSTGIDAAVIQSPNNILAIEYLRAIKKFAPQLKPVTIKRRLANYHDTAISSHIASATAIRSAILEGSLSSEKNESFDVMPASCNLKINTLIQEGRAPVTLESFNNIILAKLRSMHLDTIADLPEVNEGLHNKLSSAAFQATTAADLLSIAKSKRYTLTRLQRILIHALLGSSKPLLADFDNAGPLYARVLAFNNKGRILLKEIAQKSTIPTITKVTQHFSNNQRYQTNLSLLEKMLSFDIAATEMYVLGCPTPQYRKGAQDFLTSPLYIAD